MSVNSEWKKCKKILCVRLDNMGDVIMATPVFRALKESFPGIHLTLLTSSVGKMISPHILTIDETITYDSPWIESEQINPRADSVFNFVNLLQKKKFDGAILLTNYSQNSLPIALLMYLARIPRVLGYSRELPCHLINYWVPDTEPFDFPVHGVKRQLELIKLIGARTKYDNLFLSVNNKAIIKVKEKLHHQHIDIQKTFLVLHPGASLPRRQYPSDLFIRAGQQIIQELGCQIILTGDKREKFLAEKMKKYIGFGAVSLAGEMDLDEFMGLIKLSSVLISNNTGPVHIAAALGTPVVDLYARSNPEHTPWKVKNRVLYFDIPPSLRTKNVLLLHTTPQNLHAMPQPAHIVQAVREILADNDVSLLPKEVTTWDMHAEKHFLTHEFETIRPRASFI